MRKSKSQTNIETKQGIKLAPQQILVSSMIQASAEELQQLINDELVKNIMLESDESHSVDEMKDEDAVTEHDDEVTPDEYGSEETEQYDDNDEIKDTTDVYDDGDDYVYDSNSQSDETKDYSPLMNYGIDTSFRESLKEQISVLDISEREQFLANYIIESLEDDGYLRRQLYELVDDLAWHQNFDTTEEELSAVLTDVIQSNLEPAGIGARDLRECLLLQLEEKQSSEMAMKAYRVLDEGFEDFKAHHYEIIKQRFGYTDDDIDAIKTIIQHLNPKPGGVTASTDALSVRAAQIRPDFIVVNEDGTLVVSLCNCHVPAVRISRDYNDILQTIGKETKNSEDVKKGKSFLEEGIKSANIFIKALVQRRNTLLNVMKAIVEFQKDYFLSGNIEDLKPMALKDLSQQSKYDISTISRVCNGRYVQTEFGLLALKDMFTTGMKKKGESAMVSNATIKTALKDLVDNEDKHNPYNDDELVKKLGAMGYVIARRTVVKYRDALGISKSNLRKI